MFSDLVQSALAMWRMPLKKLETWITALSRCIVWATKMITSGIFVFAMTLELIGLSEALKGADDSPYCAFEVKVSTPSGIPVNKLPVIMVRERKETLFETTTDEKGVARICDAPLEFVGIVVGRDVCGSVQVNRLKFNWPGIQRVFITFVDNPCDHMEVRPERQVLLRVQDEKGQPLADARFEVSSASMGGGSTLSDSLGRLFRVVKARGVIEGVVTKQGKEPAHISLKATDDLELKVVLRDK